jgi:hypothetical protein
MGAMVTLGMTAIALMLCHPVLASAQVKLVEIPKEAHDEAQRSLPVLVHMVTPETYKKLGFQSVEEASQASLEAPMRVLMVRLDRLREYRPELKIGEMLEDTHEVRYPVSVGGQVRTSVVMHQIEGKWQVAKFGRPELTRALTAVIRKYPATGGTPAQALFEVKIPALNLYFVGREVESRLLLTSVVDDPRFDLKRGEELDAQKIFSRLAPYARELKTGPYITD